MKGRGASQAVFGNNEVPLFDPFLMLDDFRSNNPELYRAWWATMNSEEELPLAIEEFRKHLFKTKLRGCKHD